MIIVYQNIAKGMRYLLNDTYTDKSNDLWSTGALLNELTYQLSSANSFKIDKYDGLIIINHKYFREG